MGSSESLVFFFCKVFCVTPVDLQKGKQVLECLNTGEKDCCQPQSLRGWGTCGSLAAAAWDGEWWLAWLAQCVPTLSGCSHDSPSASLCCGWPFYFSHDEEFGLCQILTVLEKNHCCRATNTAVAVLPNSISWLWNADRWWVFLYPAEWVFLGEYRILDDFFFF